MRSAFVIIWKSRDMHRGVSMAGVHSISEII